MDWVRGVWDWISDSFSELIKLVVIGGLGWLGFKFRSMPEEKAKEAIKLEAINTKVEAQKEIIESKMKMFEKQIKELNSKISQFKDAIYKEIADVKTKQAVIGKDIEYIKDGQDETKKLLIELLKK